MLSQGDIIGAYQVLSVIGRGGFGIVYKGNHKELGVEVAIKEHFPSELCVRYGQTVQSSKPEFYSLFEDSLDRFVKEAKQLEKFRDYPNIVTCRDLFRANGTAYIVMDYVHGLPLSMLLEQREARGEPFTEQDLLQVIVPLLTGLNSVHESGVYHRDIKPSNILIRRTDRAPILIDFGAAKHEMSRHTKSFAPYSDGYAAMEQVGEGEIGPWTDIYGIGAVMWRMVAGGAPPFSPPNPVTVQKRAFELMQGRTDSLPTVRELGKERFSDRLLQAIDDCLIINVNDRVQNCAELLRSLPLDTNDATRYPGLEREAPIFRDPESKQGSAITATGHTKAHLQTLKTSRSSKNTKLVVPGLLALIGLLVITAILAQIRPRPDSSQPQDIGFASDSMSDSLADAEISDFIVPGSEESISSSPSLPESSGDEGLFSGSDVSFSIESPLQSIQNIVYAAERGDAQAQFKLGLMYDNGEGVLQDFQEAAKWYHLAAEQGLAESQLELGLMYATGEGVPEDDQEAVSWIHLAAEQGLAESQLELGLMYATGEGVPEDDQEAVSWIRLAAEQGHAQAQSYLGRMYANGAGVPRNYVIAYAWYNIAIANGIGYAEASMDEIQSLLTPTQREQAQNLSTEIYNRIQSSKAQ